MAAQSGNVTAVGDTDFLAPARAIVEGNDRFISNIASFLVNGEKAPDVLAVESGSGSNPGGTMPPQNGTTTSSMSP